MSNAGVIENRRAMITSAIKQSDIERCRRNVKIGDSFLVASRYRRTAGGVSIEDEKPRRGRVVAKYPHLVLLDTRESITYVQIAQKEKNRWRFVQ